MSELLVDFITSLDGYASGEGWPGFWGLEGREYLAWLAEQPEVTYLMGANTYRLMSGFAAGDVPSGQAEFRPEEEASVDELTRASDASGDLFPGQLPAVLAPVPGQLHHPKAVTPQCPAPLRRLVNPRQYVIPVRRRLPVDPHRCLREEGHHRNS